MRLAVLVYGRLNNCVKHHKNILESIGSEHSVDFFVSSFSPEPLLNDFIKLYKPISYINDEIKYTCNLGKYKGRRDETNIHNMTCHFMNKERVFKLFKDHNDFNYDAILSLRVDIVFLKPILFNDIKSNTIYIPNGCDWAGGLNDQLAYGDIEAMEKYMNIFKYIFDILDNGKSIPHPENLTLANIKLHNLQLMRFDLPYNIER